jgi:hypothetical protein
MIGREFFLSGILALVFRSAQNWHLLLFGTPTMVKSRGEPLKAK